MLTIADKDLRLNPQALAVLALLSHKSCDGLGEYDPERKTYKIEIETTAWYNGRERGICLEVRPGLSWKRALLVTFGECRSSDSIFVDSWEVNEYFINPPTVADCPEETYKQRTYVPYGNVASAVDVIRKKIKAFMDAVTAAQVLPDEATETVKPRRRARRVDPKHSRA